MVKLVIISGYSGSGKSAALHCLEDLGYYCIDNLPVGMLQAFSVESNKADKVDCFAISIDARNLTQDMKQFPEAIQQLYKKNIQCSIIFLEAEHSVLLKRYSETKRKHPLSNANVSLSEAIIKEQSLLAPITKKADLRIDTSQLSLHQLRDTICTRVAQKSNTSMALQIQSFGFKHGIPIDSDFIFDVRCLPNPYWIQHLRQSTGLDDKVKEFLSNQPQVNDMLNDILAFIKRWLPQFASTNRSYLTIAIGCTGGQHRSVYICEQLAKQLPSIFDGQVSVRHRQLSK